MLLLMIFFSVATGVYYLNSFLLRRWDIFQFRVCLIGWSVGSAALSGVQSSVWLLFCLPRPGLRGPKPPPPPGYSRTREIGITGELGSARRKAGDFGRRRVARAGSGGNGETSRAIPPPRNPWPIKGSFLPLADFSRPLSLTLVS